MILDCEFATIRLDVLGIAKGAVDAVEVVLRLSDSLLPVAAQPRMHALTADPYRSATSPALASTTARYLR
jgi:hypothetical protein